MKLSIRRTRNWFEEFIFLNHTMYSDEIFHTDKFILKFENLYYSASNAKQ